MIREPAFAGMFYNYDKRHLEIQVKELFSKAKTKEKNCGIVVSPHAGYMYSGKTAASAVSSLKPAKKFIILGPNHSGLGPEFSVMGKGVWRTPLGDCNIDSELADEIKKACSFVEEDRLSHSQEHSIEVQLPLLQHRFSGFTFVPVCIMNAGYSEDFLKNCESLGKAISKVAGKGNVGIIASSDFSHYLPQEIADKKDAVAVERILDLDVTGFFNILEEEDASVCGFGPIAAAVSAAKELGLKPVLLDKSSSGDATGDFGSIVSYYALGFR